LVELEDLGRDEVSYQLAQEVVEVELRAKNSCQDLPPPLHYCR
jgi:hypothetical protein